MSTTNTTALTLEERQLIAAYRNHDVRTLKALLLNRLNELTDEQKIAFFNKKTSSQIPHGAEFEKKKSPRLIARA